MLIFKHQMASDSNRQTKKRDLVLHLFVWTYELLQRGLRRTLTYNDVLQNGFKVNPVWLIKEKVMSASRNNRHTTDESGSFDGRIWCPEMSKLRTSKQMEIEVIQQMNLGPLMEESGALRCQILEHPNRWKLKSYNR